MKYFILIISFLFFIQARAFTLGGGNPDLQAWDLIPMNIDYNTANCGANLVAALNDAINTWNTVETSKMRLTLGNSVNTSVAAVMAGAGTIHNPTVVCDPTYTSNAGLGNPSGNFFSGTGKFVTSGNQIIYSYVVLNADSGTAKISSISQLAFSIALAHEIGHMVGLGHTPDPNALMYYNVTAKQKLNLSQDDMDGITYLYPRNELEGQGGGLGCASISSVTPPKPPSNLYLLFLLFAIPLLLSAWLKQKDVRAIKKTYTK